jgi:hypothetical protein
MSVGRGLLVALLLVSCTTDPVHDAEVSGLGPELPGVPTGPYHRAGQPCGVCHGGQGPAHTVFSLAGTVFSYPYPTMDKVGGVVVNVQDDTGSVCTAITNCVGNFYLQPNTPINPCDPAFPVWVGLAPPGTISQGSNANTVWMVGRIGRDSSCAACHSDPPGPASPGHVTAGLTADAGACPVSTDGGS